MLGNEDIQKLVEVFGTKDEMVTKKDLQDIKDDIFEFKSEILTGQDQILKELKTLTEEKTVKDAQDVRQKEVLKIHNTALKHGKILSEKQALEIDKLRVF